MSEELRKIFLCRRTILEMLSDRGYFIPEYDTSLTINDFISTFSSLRQLDYIYRSDTQTVFIYFLDDPKLNVKNVKPILESAKSRNITNLIIIIKESMSGQVNEIFKEYNFRTEVFKQEDILFNVTKHELVPKHRVMSRKEKEDFLLNRRIKEEQLPQILVSDVVAKYFGAEKGDLFEIQRKSETGEVSFYYRITT